MKKMFADKTKKQHFISVSEQKLNASNPLNNDRDKVKIFSFDLIDREKYSIALSSISETKAINNLKGLDLYTFGLLNNNQRLCFEKLFQRLESVVAQCTNTILDTNVFTVEEFLNVFKAKLLNMIRNPYCIKFTLSSFQELNDCYPANLELKNTFDEIERFCISEDKLTKYNVTEGEYKRWLRIIFLMITPLSEEKYILDNIAENFFNLEKYYHLIKLCKFSNEVCLLSDRSYVNLSELFDKSRGISFGFNLRHDAFIYMTFLPNDLERIADDLLGSQGKKIASFLKERGVNQIQTNLSIQPYIDNLELLRNYNRHVIYQCANNVFAASSNILI